MGMLKKIAKKSQFVFLLIRFLKLKNEGIFFETYLDLRSSKIPALYIPF